MAQGRNAHYQCAACGNDMYPSGSYATMSTLYEAIGFIPYCKVCMRRVFKRYTESLRISKTMAIKLMCVKFDIAIYPEVIHRVLRNKDAWTDYLELLLVRNKKLRAYGAGDEVKFWGSEITEEGETDENQLERWVETWGGGYTDDQYRRLDELYEGFLETRPDVGKEGEIKLKTVSEWMVRRDEMAKSDDKEKVAMAKTLQGMIETEMTSASLRRKDELPSDTIRPDDFILALERVGMVQDGRPLPYDELIELIKNDNPHYAYTKDSADQMILAVINAMRGNEGFGELATLPHNMWIVDVNGEFAKEESALEKSIKEKLGLMPMNGGKEVEQ